MMSTLFSEADWVLDRNLFREIIELCEFGLIKSPTRAEGPHVGTDPVSVRTRTTVGNMLCGR